MIYGLGCCIEEKFDFVTEMKRIQRENEIQKQIIDNVIEKTSNIVNQFDEKAINRLIMVAKENTADITEDNKQYVRQSRLNLYEAVKELEPTILIKK